MTHFVGDKFDNRYTSLVGWEQTAASAGSGYRFFFSQENMDFISAEITRILKQFGMNIRVTPEVIGGVQSDIIRSQNPILGDIWTRYTIPKEVPRNDARDMTEQTINVILNQIIGEQQQACCNSKLSVWSTVQGDFSPWGIRSHDILRTKKNDYLKGNFFMNY